MYIGKPYTVKFWLILTHNILMEYSPDIMHKRLCKGVLVKPCKFTLLSLHQSLLIYGKV